MKDAENEIIAHISHSYQKLARILEAERHVVTQMSGNVHALPDHNPEFGGISMLLDNASLVSKSIAGYLNSLADLQESIAENLSHVIREMDGTEEE